MKIQKIIFALTFCFGLATSTFASNNPVTQEVSIAPLQQEVAVVETGAAIDEFEKSVEFWVEPVPNAADCQMKEGIPA